MNAIPSHGMRVRRERPDLERLRRVRAHAADDPRLEHEDDDRRLEPRVQPDDLARLHEQARLLERLADGRLGDRLVDLEEAAGLRPRAVARARSRAGGGPPRRRR